MILKVCKRNTAIQVNRAPHSSVGIFKKAYTSGITIPQLDQSSLKPTTIVPPQRDHIITTAPKSLTNFENAKALRLSKGPPNYRQSRKNGSGALWNSSGHFGVNFSQPNDITIACDDMRPLPPCDHAAFPVILDEKLRICNHICNFQIKSSEPHIKSLKTKCLEEILARLSTHGAVHKMGDVCATKIVMMCKNNILRPITKLDDTTVFGDDLPPINEQAWPHLSLVYQILKKMLIGNSRLSIFSIHFAVDLLSILQTPDQTERSNLNAIISKFYKWKTKKEDNILPKLYHLLDDYRMSKSPPFMVGPILSLMLNIFQSLTHDKIYLMNYFQKILKLFSDPKFAYFENSFLKIVEFFTDESTVFSLMVVKALILHWPVICHEKEASFIRIMTDVLPKMSARDRNMFIQRIFSIYSRCSTSHSAKVAEAALSIWSSTLMESIIQEHSRLAITLMAHPIFTTIKEHWHKQVRESAATAFRTMTKIAPKLAHEATNGPHNDVTNEKQGDLKKWVSIARTAARFDHQINLAKKLSEITSLYNSSQKNFEQMRLPSSTRPKKYGLLL